MNCASTSCQIASTLPSHTIVASPRSQQLLGGILQIAAGWWQRRLISPRQTAPRPARLDAMRYLNSHVLRDIGFIDSLPPRG